MILLEFILICCHTIDDLVATLMILYIVPSSMVLAQLGILMALEPEAVPLVTIFLLLKFFKAYILAKKIRPYFLYFFFHFSLHPGDVLHDLFYLCVRR